MTNWGTRLAKFIRKPEAWDAVSLFAFSLLSNDVEQRAFADYLRENPALYTKLRQHTILLMQTDESIKRWSLAGLFVSYATVQADAHRYEAATGSLHYALAFFENYPLAWACYAEVYVHWENRIAARWAKKLLYFRPTKAGLGFYNTVLPDGAYERMTADLRERMRVVVAICHMHPEWADSYDFLRGIEYFQKTLGRFE